MAKTVIVPVKFIDQSNSAGKAAEGLSLAMKGIKLPASMTSEVDNLVKRLVDFQSRSKALAGKETTPGQRISIEAESKQFQKETEQMVKAIESELKNLDMPEAIRLQIAGIEKELSAKETSIKKKSRELFDLGRVNKTDVEGTGFANTRDIDKLLPKIDAYKTRIKELQDLQAKDPLKGKDLAEYTSLMSRKEAIDALVGKIEKQQIASQNVKTALSAEKVEAGKLEDSIRALQVAYGDSNPELQKAIDNLNKAKKGTKEWDTAADNLRVQIKAQKADMEGSNKTVKNFTDNVKDSVKNLFGYAAVFSFLKRTVKDSIRVITQLDKSFTEIAMVTTYSTKEVWKMKDAFIGLANTTGLTITEVSKLSVEFFRQGRSMSETMKLVEAAGIAAKLAGISTTDSVRFLTSAINGYRLSADQSMVVSDKFAALAASSATDYDELATALSKVASQAYAAGVNMDNMMGFIAKALEVTREAPENIGTAFKTIFARMQEIKDYSKTLEDGMDVNKVDKALGIIGVSLKNQQGELRNLDEVLIDVGYKWQGLTKNQKAYIATALAGTRQQTRLLAVFENFDRTMELTKVSQDSLGASFAQQAKYYASIEYAVTQLTNTWQDFISSLISSDLVKMLTNILTALLGKINAATGNWIGQTIVVISALTLAYHALAGAIAMARTNENSFSMMTLKSIKNTKQMIVDLWNAVKVKVSDAAITMGMSSVTDLASVSVLGFKTSLDIASMGVTALISGLVVLVGWMAKLAFDAWEMNGTLGNVAKTTKKLGAEIYNNKKRANDIDALIYKYQELDDKVNKTTEDLTAMAEMTQQIQDLAGEDYQVRSIIDPTKLNMDATAKAIEDLTIKADEDFQALYENAITASKKFQYSALDPLTKEYLVLGSAIKLAGKETQSEFKAMSKASQDYYVDLAKASAEYRDAFKTTYTTGENGELVTTITPVMDDAAYKAVQDRLTQGTYNAWMEADASGRAEMLSKLTDGMTDDQQKIINATLEGADTIVEIQKMFGLGANEVLDAIGSNLDAIDSSLKLLKDMNLSEMAKGTIVKDIVTRGPIDALNNLIAKNKEYGLSFKEINSLIITLNEQEFKGIDTQAAVVGLQALGKTAQEVQDMLSGSADFDITKLKEAITTYPELAAAMANSGELSNKQIETAMDLEKAKVIQELENENISYQIQIDIWKMQLDQYQKMIDTEGYLDKMSIDTETQLQAAGFDTMLADFQLFVKSKSEYDIAQSRITEETKRLMQLDTFESTAAAMQQAYKNLNISAVIPQVNFNRKADTEGIIKTAKSAVEANIKNLQAQINQYKAFQQINLKSIDKIKQGTIYKQAQKDAAEYEAKLNEIYILEQKLSVLEQKMSELQYIEDNATSGEEWVQSILDQNTVLNEQIKTTKQLTAAQKAAQDSLYKGLAPALKNTVKIIDGRMIPVMSQYNKLTPDQKKAVDEAAESFNKYSDDIDKGTKSLQDLTKEQKENIQLLEDKVVEGQKKVAEAFKEAEKKKLDALKAGLEAEKAIIEERKAMYDKAFAEDDYTNNLEEMTTKRETLIQKLAALEGATDLASLKKKEDLNKELTTLNGEYNTSVRDYNRESLLTRLDDEAKAKDDQMAAAEEAYNKLINDTAAVEAEIVKIMNGGVDETVQYLKDHLPEYTNAFSLEKDNMIDEWTLLADSAITAMDAIEGNLPDLSPFQEELNDLIAAYAKLSADALANGGKTGTVTTNPNTQNPYVEPRNKTVYFFNGKEYTDEASAISAKATAISNTKTELAKAQAIAEAYKHYSANPIDVKAINDKIKGLNQNLWGYNQLGITSKVVPYSEGGMNYRTGLAMLHGSKTRPERVLSAPQTELFEKMVMALEQKAQASKSSQFVTTEGITIGQITITTPELNTNQDFRAAGTTFAQAFKDAIAERGININKKR